MLPTEISSDIEGMDTKTIFGYQEHEIQHNEKVLKISSVELNELIEKSKKVMTPSIETSIRHSRCVHQIEIRITAS